MELGDLYRLQYSVHNSCADDEELLKAGVQKSPLSWITAQRLACAIRVKERVLGRDTDYVKQDMASWIDFVPNVSSLRKFKAPSEIEAAIKTVFGTRMYQKSTDDPNVFEWTGNESTQAELLATAGVGWGKILSEHHRGNLDREDPFTPPGTRVDAAVAPAPSAIPQVPVLPRRKQAGFKETFEKFRADVRNPQETPPVAIDGLSDAVIETALREASKRRPELQRVLVRLFDLSRVITRETNRTTRVLWRLLNEHIGASPDQMVPLKGMFNSMIHLAGIKDLNETIGLKGTVRFMMLNDLTRAIERSVADIAVEYAQTRAKEGTEITVDIESNTVLVAGGLVSMLMQPSTQRKLELSIRRHFDNPEMRQQLRETAENYGETVTWYKEHLRNVLAFAVEGGTLRAAEKRWLSELMDEVVEQIDRELATASFSTIGAHADGIGSILMMILKKVWMILTLVLWMSAVAYGVDRSTSEGLGTLHSMQDSASSVGFGYVTRSVASEHVLNDIGDVVEVISHLEPLDLQTVFEEGTMNVSKAYRVLEEKHKRLNAERERTHAQIATKMKDSLQTWKALNREHETLEEIVKADDDSRKVMNDLKQMSDELEGTASGESALQDLRTVVHNQAQIQRLLFTLDDTIARIMPGYGEVPQIILPGEEPSHASGTTGLVQHMTKAKQLLLQRAQLSFADSDTNMNDYVQNLAVINEEIVREHLPEALRDSTFRQFLGDFNMAIGSTIDTIAAAERMTTRVYTAELGGLETQMRFMEERRRNVKRAEQTVAGLSSQLDDAISDTETLMREATETAIRQNILANVQRTLRTFYGARPGEFNDLTGPALEQFYNDASLRNVARDMLAYNMSTPYARGAGVQPMYMQDPADAQRTMFTEQMYHSCSTVGWHALGGDYLSFVWSEVTQMLQEIQSFRQQSGFEGIWDALRIVAQGLLHVYQFNCGHRSFAALFRLVSVGLTGIQRLALRDLAVEDEHARAVMRSRLSETFETGLDGSETANTTRTVVIELLGTYANYANGLATRIRDGPVGELRPLGFSFYPGFNLIAWGHLGVALFGVMRALSEDQFVQGVGAVFAAMSLVSNFSVWEVFTAVADNIVNVKVSSLALVGILGFLAAPRVRLLQVAERLTLSAQLQKVFLGYTLSVALMSPYLVTRKLLMQALEGRTSTNLNERQLQSRQITKWSTFWVELGANAAELAAMLFLWNWALPWVITHGTGLWYHHDDAYDAIGRAAGTDPTFPLITGRRPRANEVAGVFLDEKLMRTADRLPAELSIPPKASGLLFTAENVFSDEADFADWAKQMHGLSDFREKWLSTVARVRRGEFEPAELDAAKELVQNLRVAARHISAGEFGKFLALPK